MRHILAVILASVLVYGCSREPTFDATSHVTVKTSVDKMYHSLDWRQQDAFNDARFELLRGETEDLVRYHGMTAEQIIRLYERSPK